MKENPTKTRTRMALTRTSIGLNAPKEDINPQDFLEIFNYAIDLLREANWILGDSLALSDRVWGGETARLNFDDASHRTGLSKNKLKKIVCVCKNIPFEKRRPELSFNHHLDVCEFTDDLDEIETLLGKAEEERLNAKDFRIHLRQFLADKTNKKVLEEGTENLDRPFGLTDVSEADNLKAYPLMTEITRANGWFSGRDLKKIRPAERREMLSDLTNLVRFTYELCRVEVEANPAARFDLPFAGIYDGVNQ